jgi:hypothetical protein
MKIELDRIFNWHHFHKVKHGIASLGFGVAGGDIGRRVMNIAMEAFACEAGILNRSCQMPFLHLASYSIAIVACGYGSYKFARYLFESPQDLDNKPKRFVPRLLRPVTQMAPSLDEQPVVQQISPRPVIGAPFVDLPEVNGCPSPEFIGVPKGASQ